MEEGFPEENGVIENGEEEGEEEELGFVITEKISNDQEEIREREKVAAIDVKNKRSLNIQNEKSLFEEFNYKRNERGIIVCKPFPNYDMLKTQEKKKGVVFLQNTGIKGLQFEKEVKNYFSQFGKVLRVEKKIYIRPESKTEDLKGFYIEFQTKEEAQDVVDKLSNQIFSKHGQKPMTLRYMENFNWENACLSSQQEDKRKILKKMVQIESEKEMRKIREFKKNLLLSKKLQKNQSKMKQNQKNLFKYKQKRSKTKTKSSSTDHLAVVFGK